MVLAVTRVHSQESPDGTGAGAWTTSTFTPGIGKRLIVREMAMSNSNNALAGSDLTLVDSTTLTWTPIHATVDTDSPGYGYASKGWISSPTTTAGTMTITLDAGSFNVRNYFIIIDSLSGEDASPVGAIAKGSDADGEGAASITLSAAPAATSYVMASCLVAHDNTVGGVDPGAGWTEDYDVPKAGWANAHGQYRTGSTSTAVDWADVNNGGSTPLGAQMLAFEIKAAAASNSADVTEVATAAESSTATNVAAAADSEAASASSAQTATSQVVAAITEPASAGSTSPATAAAVAAINESGSATESSSATGGSQSATQTEAAGATDSSSTTVVAPVSITEPATATEQSTRIISTSASTSEAASASDQPSATSGRLVPVRDNVPLMGAAPMGAGPLAGTPRQSFVLTQVVDATQTEAAAATESSSAQVTKFAATTEASSAVDASSTSAAEVAAILEPGSAAEQSSRVFSTAATVTESGAASSTQSSGGDAADGVNESITANASHTASQLSPAAIAESATSTATHPASQTSPAAVSESSSATDTSTKSVAATASESEASSAIDSSGATQVTTSNVSEGSSAGDTSSTTGQLASASVIESSVPSDDYSGTSVRLSVTIETAVADAVMAAISQAGATILESANSEDISSTTGVIVVVAMVESASAADALFAVINAVLSDYYRYDFPALSLRYDF